MSEPRHLPKRARREPFENRRPEEFDVGPAEFWKKHKAYLIEQQERWRRLGLPAPPPLPVLPKLEKSQKRPTKAQIKSAVESVARAIDYAQRLPHSEQIIAFVLEQSLGWAGGLSVVTHEDLLKEQVTMLFLRTMDRFQRERAGEPRDVVWPPRGADMPELLVGIEFGPPSEKVYTTVKGSPRKAAQTYVAEGLGISVRQVQRLMPKSREKK